MIYGCAEALVLDMTEVLANHTNLELVRREIRKDEGAFAVRSPCATSACVCGRRRE